MILRNSSHSLRQHGVSLVEVMIAMTIGLILTAGVIQLFLGSKTTYRFHDAVSRVQENARFALEALNYDVRMAGNIGCTAYASGVRNTLRTTGAGATPPSFDPGAGIQGWEATGTAPGNTFALPGATAAVVDASGNTAWTTAAGAVLDAGTMVLPGSDVVRIWRGDDNPTTITSVTPGANTVLGVTPNSGIQNAEILLISDCQHRPEVVQACTFNGNINIAQLSSGCSPGNDTSLQLETQVGGQVVKLRSYIYYVGKRNDDPNNPPGLFRRPLDASGANGAAAGTPEEVVEGVESMQILYGIDTNNDRVVERYVTANNVTNWTSVLSVQVALLMRATEIGDDISGAVTHVLGGVNATATNDRRLRQVFNTTIALRNRVP